MSKIRVLLTVPHFSPSASPYREMSAIVKYLPRDEFELTICSLRKNGIEYISKEFADREIAYFVAPFRPRAHTLRHTWRATVAQRTLAKRGPFDIQHSFDFSALPFEALLARCAGRKFVYHQRNMIPQHTHFVRTRLFLANRVVVVSKGVFDFVHELGISEKKIALIYNGIDTDAIPTRNSASTYGNYLLSVGHIKSLKRHEDAILTLNAIRDRYPHLHLLIAGEIYDKKYYMQLVSMVADLQLEDRVQFLGPRMDIIPLMNKARVLLHCSSTEGFGWTLVEAMSVGLPVVCSALETSEEIVQDGKTGILVPVGDIDEYAKAVSDVLENRERAQALAIAARHTVEERFSAKTMVSQMAELYRQLA